MALQEYNFWIAPSKNIFTHCATAKMMSGWTWKITIDFFFLSSFISPCFQYKYHFLSIFFLLFSTIFPTSINLAADYLRHHCFHEFFSPRILPDFFHIDVFSLSISWSKLHFLPCLNCLVICNRKVLSILALHMNQTTKTKCNNLVYVL